MNNNKRIFIKTWEYFFVVITVIQCNSIFLFSTSTIRLSMGVMNTLWQLALIILFFSVFKITSLNNNKLVIFIITLFILFGCLFIYNIFIYPTFNKALIIKLLIDPILLMITFNSLNNVKSLFIRFENVVLYLSSLSLLFWILHILHFPTNVSLFSTWNRQQEIGYFGLSFFTEPDTIKFLKVNWVRNSSIFAEPSIFAYVLIVALLIELFVKQNNKLFNYRILILFCAIISTASTTGVLIAFPAYIYYIINNNSNNKMNSLILIICIIPFIIILFKMIFIEKFGAAVTTNNISSSFNIRSDDINAGLKAWSHHIFLGCGLGNTNVLANNMSSWRFINISTTTGTDSAGISTVLAQGGILLSLFYIVPQIIMLKYSFKSLGLSIFLFMPFIFIAAQDFYIYIMLLSYFCYIIANNENES